MNSRYGLLIAITLMVFLTGCKNRFEEYEPYSTFDERMATEANKNRPLTPDDQMPPASPEKYAYNSAPQEPNASQFAEGTSGAGYSNSNTQNSDDLHFTEYGTNRHAYNVGAG